MYDGPKTANLLSNRAESLTAPSADATASRVSETIERLRGEHFEEAMGFLDQAFAVHGPHDFAGMLPSLYQPDDEHMQHNLALRRDGRLLGIVGVFPVELVVSGERLRAAGIGGVSVAASERGQGLLERLMDRACALIASEGYQLSFLSGPRHRYRRWGWEVCGAELRLSIDKRNLEHAFRGAPPASTRLEPLPLDPEPALLGELARLHDAQVVHCVRNHEHFARYLRAWFHKPMVARSAEGRVVGYLTGHAEQRRITELVAESDAAALDMVRAVVAHHESAEVVLPALPSALNDYLSTHAERADLRATGNWQVWDLAAVAGALLRARHAARALPEGRLVLGMGERRYSLWVSGAEAGCETTGSEPDLEASPETMLRILFGPLPPALVAPLAARAQLLGAWCPLPLSTSAQDRV